MRAVLALLATTIAIGCAHSAPSAPGVGGNGATVALPLDIVWERTMHVLAKQKPVVQSAGHGHFFITTDKAPARLIEAQADCGTYSGMSYLRDGRTLTTVAYSVNLEGDEGYTKIVVNATIDGRFQGTATHETATALSCVSRGTLEQDLIQKIQQGPSAALRTKLRR